MSDIATKKISELDQVTSFDSTDLFLLQTDENTVTIAAGSLLTSSNITYSNSSSGLSASTIQAAIDEIVEEGVGDDLPFELAIEDGEYGYYDTSGNFHSFRQPTGTATVSRVLSGYTFSNASLDGLTGIMNNWGANTVTLSSSNTATRSAGYYSSISINAAGRYTAGYNAGYNANANSGYNSGYNAGYNVGYNAGYNAGSNASSSYRITGVGASGNAWTSYGGVQAFSATGMSGTLTVSSSSILISASGSSNYSLSVWGTVS